MGNHVSELYKQFESNNVIIHGGELPYEFLDELNSYGLIIRETSLAVAETVLSRGQALC